MLELTALAAITTVALVVRWPELNAVPRFTDEVQEVLLGFRIARGQALPLTNDNPHIGSLFNYLVAGAFLLLGPKLEVGRLVVMLLGALTVVPTYLLGRALGGPAVGLLAALLLAASPTHVAVSSHIAYSHSLTPLFATAGLWLVQRAVAGRSGPDLAAGGLALGLAVQTHPSALALAPGVGIFLVWKGRKLGGRWLAAAIAAAALAVTNLLVFNATTGFRGVDAAREMSRGYLRQSGAGLDGWAQRLLILTREVAASLGGLVSETVHPDALLHPVVALYALLALGGLALLCRRGQWLPCLAIVSGLLVVSLLNGRVEQVVARGRHYAILLPLGYVAVALAVITCYQRLRTLHTEARLLDAAAGLAIVTLAFAPLLLLQDYYARAHRDGNTNLPLLATLDALRSLRQHRGPVYLDHELRNAPTLSGGHLLRTVETGLTLRAQRHAVVDLERQPPPLPTRRADFLPLVVRGDRVDLAARHYRLVPLDGEPGPGAPLRAFRAYAHGQS